MGCWRRPLAWRACTRARALRATAWLCAHLFFLSALAEAMGGKKGGKKGAKHGGGGKGGHKQDERRERQARRREERLKQWHDPKWKQDFQRFEAQLRVLGLRIVDMTGDGNCMFRAVSDQMEGTAEHHRRVRRQAVESLRAHREQFAPFLDTGAGSGGW